MYVRYSLKLFRIHSCNRQTNLHIATILLLKRYKIAPFPLDISVIEIRPRESRIFIAQLPNFLRRRWRCLSVEHNLLTLIRKRSWHRQVWQRRSLLLRFIIILTAEIDRQPRLLERWSAPLSNRKSTAILTGLHLTFHTSLYPPSTRWVMWETAAHGHTLATTILATPTAEASSEPGSTSSVLKTSSQTTWPGLWFSSSELLQSNEENH